MGVQQVRGAVQGRDRLAGARAALYDQDALQAGRITRSCSAWMVATTLVIRPVRAEVMLAISMASPDRDWRSGSDSRSRSKTSLSTPVTVRSLV